MSYAAAWPRRRPLEPGQYTSIRYTERLLDAGIEASVGRVGDWVTDTKRALDAMMTGKIDIAEVEVARRG